MVATETFATALVKTKSGPGFLPGTAARSATLASRCRRALLALSVLLPAILVSDPAVGASNKVRITKLVDIAFGTIANLGSDAVRSESVCLYAETNTNGYNVTATGTGPAGAFQLSSGAGSMAFDVQWSSSSGQSSGSQLVPNVPLTGQVSSATQQACTSGPATSASLIVILRSTALSSARAGTYNGTLTLLIGPE